jgi:hypothetical protein
VVFVGRPEGNSALAAWMQKLGLNYANASFRIADISHASEREALILAAQSPIDPARMVLVIAGNDALRTVKLARSLPEWERAVEFTIQDDGRTTKSGFLAK